MLYGQKLMAPCLKPSGTPCKAEKNPFLLLLKAERFLPLMIRNSEDTLPGKDISFSKSLHRGDYDKRKTEIFTANCRDMRSKGEDVQ